MIIRHGLMLLWFKDLINVTEKVQFIDPMSGHSCLVPSSGMLTFFCQNIMIIRHGLMLLWFKDLINVTEKLQFIDPMSGHSCLVPSSGVV